MIEGENITVNEPELKFYEMPEFDKKTYELLRKRQKAKKEKQKDIWNYSIFLIVIS